MTKRTRLHVEALENRCVPAAMLHPDLDVRQVVSGLARPITMAFLGDNEFLILEKDTGMVKHVVNGAVRGTVLDLPVNTFQQRGLLSVALHPEFFSKDHREDDDGDDRDHDDDRDEDDDDHNKKARPYVYLSWTESSTGADSAGAAETALLGNRLDRFVWDGTALNFDRTLMRTRAIQDDAVADPAFWGRHQGGPIAFGPDGKLYYFLGDTGRRGWLQILCADA